MKKTKYLILIVYVFTTYACIGQNKQTTRTKYLLLNNQVIEKVENAKLTVGVVTKHPSNPLFVEDKP